jgi:hypothetical protein
MSRAYKLPNAAATIAEIEAAQEVLNDLQSVPANWPPV